MRADVIMYPGKNLMGALRASGVDAGRQQTHGRTGRLMYKGGMSVERMTVADLERALLAAQQEVEIAEKRREVLREAVDAVRRACPYLGAQPTHPLHTEPAGASVDEGRRALGFALLDDEERVPGRAQPHRPGAL